MKRLTNWEQRLNDYLADVFDKPYEWGTHDCALHAANAVEAQTGVDLAQSFRGQHSDEAGANAAISAAGYSSLAALVDDLLPRVVRSSAQRGDLVLTKEGNLAVVWGPVALAVGHDEHSVGLIRIPREDWRKAWRVG
jgi:hypothetical protein